MGNLFKDEFVPNIQGHNKTSYNQWKNSNPGEAAKWEAYRDAVLVYEKGDPPIPVPNLATKYGKALVAAGKLQVSVTDIGAAQPVPPEPPPPDPPPDPPPAGAMRYGTQCWTTTEIDLATPLGLRLIRTGDSSPQLSVDAMRNYLLTYQNRGCDPLLLLNTNQMNSNMNEFPGNVPAMAAQLGPGGPLAHPTHPLRFIEIGNEQFYTFAGKPGPGYAPTYAAAFANLSTLVRAANPNVKLLCQCDGGGSWPNELQACVDGLYTVPNFHNYVDYWLHHAYGPMGNPNVTKVEGQHARLAAKGAPNTIPIAITEDGIATDNGTTLTNNYGWPTNLTYAQAGTSWRGKVNGMRGLTSNNVGSRIKIYMHYIIRDRQPHLATNQREDYFGMLQSNGAAKGDFTQAVRDFTALYP